MGHQRPDQELETACGHYPWPLRTGKIGGACKERVRFTIESADWTERLRVDDYQMFVEVMRGVRKKLKQFPDSLTKSLNLVLDIPAHTPKGWLLSFQMSGMGNCPNHCPTKESGDGQDRSSRSCP